MGKADVHATNSAQHVTVADHAHQIQRITRIADDDDEEAANQSAQNQIAQPAGQRRNLAGDFGAPHQQPLKLGWRKGDISVQILRHQKI